jgi:uncharacterized phage-associated protein
MSTIEILDTNTEQIITDQYPTNEIAIANWFLARAAETGKELTPSALQTLVQLSYGWYFVAYQAPLFAAMPIAQPYGPTLPSLDVLYTKPSSRVRVFQDNKIEVVEYQIELPENELSKLSEETKQHHLQIVEQIKAVLTAIWNVYKDFPPNELAACLCVSGTPWDKIDAQTRGRCSGVVISHKAMQDYFLDLHEQSQKNIAEKQKNNDK